MSCDAGVIGCYFRRYFRISDEFLRELKRENFRMNGESDAFLICERTIFVVIFVSKVLETVTSGNSSLRLFKAT